MTTEVERLVIRVDGSLGMVNIDGPGLAYGNIADMYQGGNGYGLQLDERLEHCRGEIIDLCDAIADKIYELQARVSAITEMFSDTLFVFAERSVINNN